MRRRRSCRRSSASRRWIALTLAFLAIISLPAAKAQELSEVEQIRLGKNRPPYSIKCGTLLFAPLQESCGFENGELVSLIIDLLSDEDKEVQPTYPIESCSKACSEAVFGIIRTNEACKDVKQWLPVGITDLRQLMGKRYGRACDGMLEEAEQNATDVNNEMEADLKCLEALDSCSLMLPESKGLDVLELNGNRMLMDYWSCPETCSMSNITMLLTERCTKALIVRSIIRSTWDIGDVSVQSASPGEVISAVETQQAEPPGEAQHHDVSSVLSLLSGDRGLDHVCMRKINPTGEKVTLVRLAITGLRPSSEVTNAEISNSISYALATIADALPEQVQTQTTLGPNGMVCVEAHVVFPASDRIRSYEFSRMLHEDLQAVLGIASDVLLTESARLKSIRSLSVDDMQLLPSLEESSIDMVSSALALYPDVFADAWHLLAFAPLAALYGYLAGPT